MPTATSQRRLSQIAPLILQSEIRSMSVECDRIGGVNLAQGVCDTELPPPAAHGAIDAINRGLNTYTRLDGIAPLRAAIAAKLATYNGIHADPEAEILVTSGATGALYTAALALLDPGDEVVLFEPFYGYHWNTMLSLRAVPVAVTLDAPRWHLDIGRLRAAITPRTRAIIVNTPSNPCGKVFSLEELQAIAALAIEHDLFVFTDEIYEYFLFDGRRHTSLATLPGMAERTITTFTFSKTYGMTGWRAGYTVAKEPFMTGLRKLVLYSTNGVTTPVQYAMIEALKTPEAEIARRREEYRKRRDLLVAGLNAVGLECEPPAGAFYAFPNAEKIHKSSRVAAEILLEKAHIATIPGVVFGAQGEGHLRFGYAVTLPEIEGCVETLHKFFGK